MKNKCQNRVPGHPIYKVGHNLTGFNNILEGGIVPSIVGSVLLGVITQLRWGRARRRKVNQTSIFAA